MEAIVLKSAKSSEYVTDKPMPKISHSDEVLIKVEACGVCATDLKMYQGEYSGYLPIVPGHEFCGKVVEVGEKVTRLKVGDRVTVDPNESCGACDQCRSARSTFCKDMAAYGVFTDGGLAQYAKSREKGLYKIPEGLSAKIAAFVEPISCAVHGVDQSNIRLGDTVAIIGAGTMGQLLLQMVRNTGASRIIHIDRIDWKLEVSRRYGATDVINSTQEDPLQRILEITGGKGASVVIEAVGNPAVLELAMTLVARGGRIVQFGFAAEGAKAMIEPFAILQKELTIVGSWINPYTYDRALELLTSGKVSVDHLITHTLRLDEYEKAIHLIKTQPEGFMKAVILM